MNIEDHLGNIYLLQKKAQTHPGEVQRSFAGRKICACDFAISGSERGQLGDCCETAYEGLLIIDHHSPIPQMQRQISSTVIANAYVRQHGSLGADWAVAINHTDADSILSALVMTGRLPTSDEWSDAAIAADHTGEENLLSDVLQALEDNRNLEKSLTVALKLSADRDNLQQMPDVRQLVLEKRGIVRQALRQQVERGAFHWLGDIAWIVLDKKVDAALAPALLPEARLIVIASAMPVGSAKPWRIRARLGVGVEGLDLSQLHLPDSGGRWNAVSTSRHGGTNISPQDYVRLLAEKIAQR